MNRQKLFDDASKKKDKVTASVGTTIIFVSLLVLFMILGFKTPLPYPEEEGAYVMLGETDFGSPSNPTTQVYEPQPAVQEKAEVKEESVNNDATEEALTQEAEDAPVVKKETKKETKKEVKKEEVKKETKTEVKTEENTKADETVRQSNKLYEFNKINDGKGTGADEGNQGSEGGDPNSVKPGEGGGTGFSFNMKGRGLLKGPPKITGKNQRAEKVVIEITVNKNGKVIRAKPVFKGGATITTGTLVNKALEAAKKLEFSKNSNAFEEQIGTITFNFRPYK
ncbi:MAG: hypothetical protein U9R42_07055 [Bacteroidota bacterium]|nr:hypothetical protein [Bacteroidota bacterium]